MGGDRKRFKLSPQSKEYFEPDSSHNLLSALRDSQTSSSERRLLVHTLRDVLSSKLLPPLLETQPKPSNLRHSDKCFACAWVSDTHVVVGTKCNKLVCVNAVTLQMHDIILPPKPVRVTETGCLVLPGSLTGILSQVQGITQSSCGAMTRIVALQTTGRWNQG